MIRTLLLTAGVAAAMTFTAAAARQSGMQDSSMSQDSGMSQDMNNPDLHSTQIRSAEGKQVTVRWGQPAQQPPGPRPAFSALDSDGNGSISKSEASSYTLLANDFIHADRNENGSISKAEYSRWH